MLVLYNISIRLYHFAVFIASFFNPKAKRWLSGRDGLLKRIEQETSDFSGETLWVHCASLGEFEMARPIMESLKESDAKLRVVLTFFSPSGYEIRKDYKIADHVYYLPLDTTANARRFVTAIKPSKVVFVRYDLWFHHLNEAKKLGAKLMLISAQFRPDQQYFQFYGGIGRKALKLFDRIFLVDTDSEKLLAQIDVTNTVVCGDTRYDRVMAIANSVQPNQIVVDFKANGKLVICGSTWPEDEQLILDAVNQFPDVKWVVAPHEVGEENIQRLEKLFPSAIRYSKYSESDAKVLIIDSIGLLNTLYGYADAAYVGGAFRTGLHNILEATAFGVPTVFGPDTSRFPDAAEMDRKGLVFRIENGQQLNARFNNLLNTDQSELRKSISEFMDSRVGATKAILEYMDNS